MSVKLVWCTEDAQNIISYCARVSNPSNQENYNTAPKLLKYCAKNKHWSVFEMASMCIEIETTRAISAQILRHRSFSFQEYSQRYALSTSYELPNFREQDNKNRQNSLETVSEEKQNYYQIKSKELIDKLFNLYEEMAKDGIAKETARMILPLCTKTRLYMTGTIRNWIHYVQVRGGSDTQKEHREIALEIKKILLEKIPILEELFDN